MKLHWINSVPQMYYGFKEYENENQVQNTQGHEI